MTNILRKLFKLKNEWMGGWMNEWMKKGKEKFSELKDDEKSSYFIHVRCT